MVRRIALLFALLSALPALASTYYVDCNAGSDNNTGTSLSAAWKTVGKVNSSSFVPGDNILFDRGCTWTDAYIATSSSGTAASPITYGVYGSGAQPVIQQYYGAYVTKSYIVLDGLHFSHDTNTGILAGNANINNVTVQNCTIDYSTYSGIFLYGNAPGSYTVGSFTFLHNTIAHNGSTANDHGIYIDNSSNNVLDGNTWDSNVGYGIQIQDSSDNNIVRYNYFVNNGLSDPVHQWGGALAIYNNQVGTYHLPTGNQIYGNVSNGDRYGLLTGGTTATVANTVVNNTFVGNQYGLIIQSGIGFGVFKNNIVWTTSSGNPLDVNGSLSSDYNLLGPTHSGFLAWNGGSYASLAAYAAATGDDSQSTSANPAFVDTANANFTLQSNSPAIDAGTNLGAGFQQELNPASTFPWSTVNENSYGSAWEIGAFVFVGGGGGGGVPSPPTGLTAILQ